jgi:HPt (histidine-containing phosphotransfer) domain-containing protein
LGQTAHALKGSCGNVGATGMAAVAQQLQLLGKSNSVQGATDLIMSLEKEFTRVRTALDSYRTTKVKVQ